MFTHISYSCRSVCIYRCHPFAEFICTCEVWGCHSGVIENSDFLGCHVVLLGVWSWPRRWRNYYTWNVGN